MKRILAASIFIFFVQCQLILGQDFGMGLQFDDNAYGDVSVKSGLLTRDYEELPKSYSLKKYCPSPKSQGRYATCVGWSSAYAARTIIEARQKKPHKQRRNQQISFFRCVYL